MCIDNVFPTYQAFQLAQKDAIDEVAETYAPSAWFADHKHPEKAAMLHVVNSRRDADKLVDQVGSLYY